MKRLLLFAVLLVCIVSGQSLANPITRQKALENAQAFLKSKGRSAMAQSVRKAPMKATAQSDNQPYYLFNVGNNQGFVVAAGDDNVPAILGYSDKGTILPDSLPSNMKEWLKGYQQQIEYIQKHNIAASDILTASHPAISPLLTTTWDQDEPYNNSCPDFFTGDRCVTGCVATAMAQVMYYHRNSSVTKVMKRIEGYTCRHKWISGSDTLRVNVNAVAAGSTIDWSNMLNSYSGSETSTQKKAVADLMFYCGASVGMDYADQWNGGSGASSSYVPNALKTYFGYSDNTKLVNRSSYSATSWDNLIYSELSNKRPVFYSGRNSEGGHAFVCDSYFLLDNLLPEDQGIGGSNGGFNQEQAAIIGAEPSGNITPPVQQYTVSVVNADSNLHIYDRNGNDITDAVLSGTKYDAGSYFRFVLEIGDAYYISEIKVNGVSVGQWGENNASNEYVIESLSGDKSVEFTYETPVKYKTVYCAASGPGNVKMYKNGTYVGTTTDNGSGNKVVSVVINPNGGDVIKLEFIPDEGCSLSRLGCGFYDVDTETNDISNQISNNTYTIKYSSDEYADHRCFTACFEEVGAAVILNETNFPDANFRAYISQLTGVAENGTISEDKLLAVKTIDVNKKSIKSLKGVEFFTALISLYCYENELVSLDVTKNTALTNLVCYGNKLTSLDVSNNTILKWLHCYNNQLTSLDVTRNTALTELFCYDNKLTSLDVSKNTALICLNCSYNQLTNLDVSKHTAMKYLNCECNQLTSIDVTQNTALTELRCYLNQLTAIDVTMNTALEVLFCYNNQLTNLDLTKNTALVWLHCSNNQLTSLDVSKNTALTVLNCGYNQLTSIDVSKNTALTSLDCSGNQLASFDVSKNTALTSLGCSNNPLTSLDISNNTALTSLWCYENQLTILDVSKNTALTQLYCFINQLTGLDVSKNTALTRLECYNNQLTSLDVTKNMALKTLSCKNNQLTSLYLSKNTQLAYKNINHQSSTLSASSNGNLYSINVGSGVNGSKISEFKVDGVSVTPSIQNGVLSFISSAKPQVITYMYDTDNSVAGKMDVTINVSISDENADTDISQMDNVVYIDRTEVKTGGQTVLSIKMKNSAPIRGFQFDLYLPNGVTAAKNSKGRIVASLSSGRLGDDDEHTLTTAEQADGGIRFLSSSLYDENFMGNDGEIVSLTVNVAEDMEDGDYPLEIKNARLTETDISRYYITDYVKSTLAVSSYMLGDINADDEVDVRDYTGVANHIMGNTPEGFVMKAGDIDENGEIDVRDYTGIANIIMTSTIGSNHSPAKRSMDKMKASAPVDLSSLDNVAYVADATITAGTQTDLSICMKNSAPIRGFQFDLYLPEGVTVAKTEKGRIIASLSSERLDVDDEHTLITEEQADGAIRFLCSSLYDENFTGNEGEIASLKVNVSEDAVSGEYTVLLKNIILTETDISKYYKTDEIESVLTIEDKGDGRLHFDESSATLPNYTVGEKANVAMKRKLTAGNWSTIVLPFTLTKEKAETVFGSDMQLAEFSGFSTEYSDDNDVIPDAIQIHFSTYTMTARKNMTGGKLFLIKTAKDMESFEADEVTLANAVTDVSKADEWGTNGKFTGSLVKTIVPENGLFINDNKFWYSTGLTNIKAFRGWFELGAVLNKNTDFSAKIAFFIDNEETSIEGLTKGARLDGTGYTLNGQLVGRNLSDKNLQKGVYIRNGKKFVVK